MNLKYQIFVSSTYEDLKVERNEVIKACLNMGHIPVGMEMFNAADEEQWAVITRTIDQCDYYVVIVAHRYGSTTPEGVSFTEKEYDYAVERGVPVLGFMIDSGAAWPGDRFDSDPKQREAVDLFKSKIMKKMVRFWKDRQELHVQFATSISTYINVNPRRGWVRAPEGAGADIAQALSDLTQENARLRNELDGLKRGRTQMGETDTIIAAMRRFEIREGEGEITVGDKFFVRLANLLHQRKSIEQLGRGIHEDDFKEFQRNLYMMGLLETSVKGSRTVTKLTQLGGLVYARLLTAET